MDRLRIIFVILSIGLFSCQSNVNKFSDKRIIKHLYDNDCFEFRMDTLKSLDYIKPFLDLLANSHPEICSVDLGCIYNLADSSFVPSNISEDNTVIKLDDVHNCPIIGMAGHDFAIYSVTQDSLTMAVSPYSSFVYYTSRIPLTELKNCFSKNLDTLFNENKMSANESFIVCINIIDLPEKSAIMEIIEVFFWEYNERALKSIKNDFTTLKMPLNRIIRELEKKDIPLWTLIEPIHFELINDTSELNRTPYR